MIDDKFLEDHAIIKLEVIDMIKVTASAFKKNLDKYLSELVKEEIIIIRDGVSVAKVILPEKESIASKLRGIIPNDGYSIEDARKERLAKQ